MNKLQYKLTILGCGSSTGVPSIEDGWGLCNENNIKNQRTRTSSVLEIFSEDNNLIHTILFDTSPDFRQQAINNKIKSIDSVLYTHAHADHIYGLDDLRGINRITNRIINCYASSITADIICNSFGYVFTQPANFINTNKVINKPLINMNVIDYNDKFNIFDNIMISTTKQYHNNIETMGFVVNNKIGYATDFHRLSKEALQTYNNLDLLLISATVLQSHPSHTTLQETLDIIRQCNIKEAIIIHMSNQIDYKQQAQQLPDNVKLAYDSMVIKI